MSMSDDASRRLSAAAWTPNSCIARNGLEIAKLSLRRRLIRSNGRDRSRFLAVGASVGTGPGGRFHRSIDDPTHGGAKLEVGAELSAEPEGSKRAANRLGLGLLQVIPEVTGRFAAPAGCRPATRDRHHGAEDRGVVIVGHELGLDRGVRVLIAHPDQAPLHLEVVGPTDAGQVTSRFERGAYGHRVPPSVELLF